MLRVEDGTTLPLLYHLNSEPWMNFEAYADQPYEVEFKHEKGIADPVSMPRPDANSQLLKLLAKRRSCRKFSSESLSLSALGTLLGGAYGLTNSTILPSGFRFHSRSVPSAGGLYPLELYLIANRIDGVTDGLYHFEAPTHLLKMIQPAPTNEQLERILLAQQFLQNANAIIFISAVFRRTLTKYGSRGYRYILLEAGHLAQNLCLLSAELDLGSLCVGGFWDSRLNSFIGLNGVDDAVVYCVGVGHPDE